MQPTVLPKPIVHVPVRKPEHGGAPLQLHMPAVQRSVVVIGHTVPQAPQWLLFVWVSMQVPPQQALVAPLHTLPQEPQLLLSVIVFTQVPPHAI